MSKLLLPGERRKQKIRTSCAVIAIPLAIGFVLGFFTCLGTMALLL